MTPIPTDMETPIPNALSFPVSAFDDVAASYDSRETHDLTLQWMRHRVHQLAAETFESGGRLLDIGCGTGTDALFFARRGHHVVATDPSNGMLTVAIEKIGLAGLSHCVTFKQVGGEEIGSLITEFGNGRFDGIFSNFGALNCIADLHPFGHAADALLHPGGKIVVTIMPPVCPWEILYFLCKFQPSKAFRRWRGRTGTDGLSVPVGNRRLQTYYHCASAVRHCLAGRFQLTRQMGLCILLPPPYLQRIVRRQRVFDGLSRAEVAIREWLLIRSIGDHMVMIFEKSQDA